MTHGRWTPLVPHRFGIVQLWMRGAQPAAPRRNSYRTWAILPAPNSEQKTSKPMPEFSNILPARLICLAAAGDLIRPAQRLAA